MLRNSQSDKAIKQAIKLGYKISKQGTLTNPNGKIMSGYLNTYGYKRLSIKVGDKVMNLLYHQFQAYMKYGDEVFNTQCVRHLNDIAEDNSWDNIAIGSYKDNSRDSIKNGTLSTEKGVAAMAAARRTYNDEQCVEIYELLKAGKSKSELIKILNYKSLDSALASNYYKVAIENHLNTKKQYDRNTNTIASPIFSNNNNLYNFEAQVR